MRLGRLLKHVSCGIQVDVPAGREVEGESQGMVSPAIASLQRHDRPPRMTE